MDTTQLAALLGLRPIFLLHSTSAKPARDLSQGLHNITPDIIHNGFAKLQRIFSFLSLDELMAYRGKTSVAALTFDDGYTSVFQEAYPVLKELRIPFVIYLNCSSFTGKPFWRDMIRTLVNRRLEYQFHEYCQAKGLKIHGFHKHGLYKSTKSAINNSKVVHEHLSGFFERFNIDAAPLALINREESLIVDPIISYGNHTYNHYLLSSLPRRDQQLEIEKNKKIIHELKLQESPVFSLPFGGDHDFDEHTVQLAKEFGYKAILLSRNRLNGRRPRRFDCQMFERFMPSARQLACEIPLFAPSILIKSIVGSF
ncbi:MAG TPA: hypothetical protein DIS62_00640 [Candidatus Kerfeldbacteria bacterium]|nr:hypothetical protein [Candidatus Kerfeldbacteria bacterium]